jgi:hypothetical protein
MNSRWLVMGFSWPSNRPLGDPARQCPPEQRGAPVGPMSRPGRDVRTCRAGRSAGQREHKPNLSWRRSNSRRVAHRQHHGIAAPIGEAIYRNRQADIVFHCGGMHLASLSPHLEQISQHEGRDRVVPADNRHCRSLSPITSAASAASSRIESVNSASGSDPN